MHVHGSGELDCDPDPEDPQLIDLDALGANEDSAQTNVA
jgi:hypothetical protein